MHVFDGFTALAAEQPAASDEAEDVPRLNAPGVLHAAGTVSGSRSPDGTTAPSPASQVLFDPAAEPAPAWARVSQRKRIVACVLLAALFLGQLGYLFRGELAARSQAMKTITRAVCGLVGCSIALPHRPDLVKIEASDVNMIDTSRPGLIQLTATLRSYADHDLAYPALDLVLTNATEHALARRIFVPEEYLQTSRDPLVGMPPRGEITVALDLDTGNLNAAGFRLDLLPAR
jgi:hypothetical protein